MSAARTLQVSEARVSTSLVVDDPSSRLCEQHIVSLITNTTY